MRSLIALCALVCAASAPAAELLIDTVILRGKAIERESLTADKTPP